MFRLEFLSTGLLISALLASSMAYAQVDAVQAARLGKDLTPIGGERAGNTEGTIPAWDGGLAKRVDAYDPVMGYKDPFVADKPLLTISAANADRYADKLSPGQMAMLKRYPKTWKLLVYPTRRSASYPEHIYEAVKLNALNAKLVEDGNGVADAKNVVPFPIPHSGLEVLWNHLMRYRGVGIKRNFASAQPQINGDYVLTKLSDIILFNQDVTDNSKSNGNILVYTLQSTLAPARQAGGATLVHDTVNQVNTPRLAWNYAVGQRRVRRAPQIAYDNPSNDGLTTTDNNDMFSGAPDRYDWQLIGKKEMYVPYNSFRLASKMNKYSDIIRPGHVNPELLRYELHRVWHVRGVLKEGQRHIYKQRDLFLDEDTYQIVVADHYDNRGEIWRVGEANTINYYDQPLVWVTGGATYDLISGRYNIGGLANEEGPFDFNASLSPADFSPGKLRQDGVR